MPIREEQQVQKQHPVPQNIMSVEFKLIGDLTIRQFFYVAAGAVIAYLAYQSSLSFLFRWLIILLFGLGGAAMAFIPLEDRGLDQWIINFIQSISTPTQRVWIKNPALPAYFLNDYAQQLKQDLITLAPPKSRQLLRDYLGGIRESAATSPLDLREENFLARLNFEAPLSVGAAVTTTEPPSEQELASPPVGVKSQVKEKAEREGGAELPMVIPVIDSRQDLEKIPWLKNIRVSRHLRHFPLEGEIVLPARERRLFLDEKVSPETKAAVKTTPTGELDRKTRELMVTVKKIRGEIALRRKDQEKRAAALKEKVLTKTDQDKKVIPEEKALAAGQILTSPEAATEPKVSKEVPPPKTPPPPPAPRQEPRQVPRPKTVVPDRPDQPLANVPNIIRGVVQDRAGHLLEDVLVIVKDTDGDPIRALKTDSLGQFVISTPVPNGEYSINVAKEGETFAIIKVMADGSVLRALSIKGRAAENRESKS